jgi:hypothetical protein
MRNAKAMTPTEELIGNLEALRCTKEGCRPIAHEVCNETVDKAIEIIRQHFAAQAHDPHHPDVRFAKKAADYSYMDLVNPPQRSEISYLTVKDIAEILVSADTDEHGSEDWKHYKHMAEALAGRLPKPVTVSLENCAKALAKHRIDSLSKTTWTVDEEYNHYKDEFQADAKTVLEAAGVPYVQD